MEILQTWLIVLVMVVYQVKQTSSQGCAGTWNTVNDTACGTVEYEEEGENRIELEIFIDILLTSISKMDFNCPLAPSGDFIAIDHLTFHSICPPVQTGPVTQQPPPGQCFNNEDLAERLTQHIKAKCINGNAMTSENCRELEFEEMPAQQAGCLDLTSLHIEYSYKCCRPQRTTRTPVIVEQESKSDNGLSTVAIIGIAVGAGVGVLLLLTCMLVLICCCCCCRKSTPKHVSDPEKATSTTMKSETLNNYGLPEHIHYVPYDALNSGEYAEINLAAQNNTGVYQEIQNSQLNPDADHTYTKPQKRNKSTPYMVENDVYNKDDEYVEIMDNKGKEGEDNPAFRQPSVPRMVKNDIYNKTDL